MSSNVIVYNENNCNELSTFEDGISAIDATKQLVIETQQQNIIKIKQKYATYRYELETIEKKIVKQIMDNTSQCIAKLDAFKDDFKQKKYE